MKKTYAGSILVLFLLFSLLTSPAVAVSLTITQPSPAESVLAEGRDFYVWGDFDNPSASPVNIRISLVNAGGDVVRSIQSQVNESGVTPEASVNMSRIPDADTWGGVLAPDVIEVPGGYANAENKLLVTKTYYHGMIQGGATKEMGTYFVPDASGSLREIEGIIPAGEYTLTVEAFDAGGEVLARQDTSLTFGLTNASLGLFRPENTKQKLLAYAAETGRRVYQDWFPGYFQLNGGGYEIPDRWQPNNVIEVVNELGGTVVDTPDAADNTVTIYNIAGTPATYEVELAAILRAGLEDAEHTVFLYYDAGEPEAVWRDASSGRFVRVSGELTEFPAPDAADDARVRYTHADVSGKPGVLHAGEVSIPLLGSSRDVRVDASPYNVNIVRGDEVAFYGVVRPIAAEVVPLDSAGRGAAQNAVVQFTYTNDVLGEFTFPVGLNRTFADGFIADDTRYEFGHLFARSVTRGLPFGEYVFSVAGYDTDGVFVEGTNARVSFTVVPGVPMFFMNMGRTEAFA